MMLGYDEVVDLGVSNKSCIRYASAPVLQHVRFINVENSEFLLSPV